MSPKQEPLVLFRRAKAGLNRAYVKSFAPLLAEEVAKGKPFTCLITDDRELRRLNCTFLGKDYPTDVLSFPAEKGFEKALGEIAISSQRAQSQAASYGHSTEDEICILMLHGLLHLLGMDHETDRGRMARAERKWREAFSLPVGPIERASK